MNTTPNPKNPGSATPGSRPKHTQGAVALPPKVPGYPRRVGSLLREVLTAFTLALTLFTHPIGAAERATYLLEGGLLLDGSGTAGIKADLAIAGDRIVAIGDLSTWEADTRLNLDGLVLAPGFIDIHSHAVRDKVETSGLFLWPDAENYIRQGVTSAIGGPDGGSWYPIQPLLERAEAEPAAINFGTFVGHNTVRAKAMGRAQRAASADELAQMQEMIRQAMRDGAFGLSAGLKYIPGAYASTEEVIELAKAAAEFNGLYIVHLREEGTGLLDSIAETVRIGAEGGLPVQVTHHKAMGVQMWGRSVDSLALLDAANARGLDITSDQYPYTASSTGLKVLFPAWSLEGNRAERMARLADPQQRARIKAGIINAMQFDRGGDNPARVAIASCGWKPEVNGMNLAEILQSRQEAVNLINAAELVMELETGGSCSAVYHSMNEEDVRRIMQHPKTMIASDGGIYMPGDNVPHPRNYGSFARVLGVYVRQEKVLDLATAIHKMSGMPADRLGLKDRGYLIPGRIADIAVFDPETVIDRATFKAPHQMSEGMYHVFVNGTPALLNGEMTGQRPGRVLRSNESL